jgi:hypothetical protein
MSMQMTIGRAAKSETIQFRLLYAICFGIFLSAAVIQKVLPWRWFVSREGTIRQSIFAQARNAAGICATYAFMV